jgi:hypothetical protein
MQNMPNYTIGEIANKNADELYNEALIILKKW